MVTAKSAKLIPTAHIRCDPARTTLKPSRRTGSPGASFQGPVDTPLGDKDFVALALNRLLGHMSPDPVAGRLDAQSQQPRYLPDGQLVRLLAHRVPLSCFITIQPYSVRCPQPLRDQGIQLTSSFQCLRHDQSITFSRLV